MSSIAILTFETGRRARAKARGKAPRRGDSDEEHETKPRTVSQHSHARPAGHRQDSLRQEARRPLRHGLRHLDRRRRRPDGQGRRDGHPQGLRLGRDFKEGAHLVCRRG